MHKSLSWIVAICAAALLIVCGIARAAPAPTPTILSTQGILTERGSTENPFAQVAPLASAGTPVSVRLGRLTFVRAYTIVDTSTCTYLGDGSMTNPVRPHRGFPTEEHISILYQTGACAGHTFPSDAEFYTWTDSTGQAGDTDYFTLHFTAYYGATVDSAWTPTLTLPIPIVVSPSSLPNAEHYLAYTGVQFSATGGDGGPYAWSAAGLPSGFSLSSVGSLASAQVTAMPGTYTFTISATDGGGDPAGTRTVSLIVNGMDCTKHVQMQDVPAPVVAQTAPYGGTYVNNVYLESGTHHALDPLFGWLFGFSRNYGINIYWPYATVTDGTPGITEVMVQDEESDTGEATYTATTAKVTAYARSGTPSLDKYLYGHAVIDFYVPPQWTDSPDMEVPLYYGGNHANLLSTFSFTKKFAVFAGCHSADDGAPNPAVLSSEIRPMKTFSWEVNLIGTYVGGNFDFTPASGAKLEPTTPTWMDYTGSPTVVVAPPLVTGHLPPWP